MSNVVNKEYIQTLLALKERIVQAQYNSYSAVNSEMILAYLDIGKTLSEKTKTGWGTSVIQQLSKDLQAEFNGVRGFSERNLYRMKLVYEEMQENAISPQAVAKLSWGHTALIFSKIKDKAEREFYLEKANAEYEQFRVEQDKKYISDLDRALEKGKNKKSKNEQHNYERRLD